MRRWSGSGSGSASASGSGAAADRDSQEAKLLRLEVERLRALVPPNRRLPKLLVLDLNGFLVHRVFMGGDGDKGPLPRVASTWTLNNFVVYERPHAREFLRFCLDNFHVGVWTTASANNATPLIEGLLDAADMAKLAFIWDGKRCTYNGQTDPSKPGKPIAFKELRKLWESRDAAGLFGPDNTLLIDDSTYKASLNPPHTAIHPRAWDDPERLATDAELSPSGKIRGYLAALLEAADSVPDFIQRCPFESFVPRAAAVQGAMAAVPVLSAAAIEAGLLPAPGAAAGAAVSTPELDYHRGAAAAAGAAQKGSEEDEEEEEEDDDDEIVLAPALAGLSLRPA